MPIGYLIAVGVPAAGMALSLRPLARGAMTAKGIA
jgi:hypothetical protein